ncbi:uncharacterized protein K460DRAFT_318276 [Cucurbitaria berberidis CBS 394.84]|uniref:Fungal-type protein kinase domain-containing protein n=1 Tax=Cucurbitaria berberidis CBS 394.84 TaxID=1168544 RepID=A0A9P4G934_9PLEO|nr:uncharacterized protein K460DRAFT_318276 [Cucurbitaria berberidis CBS 394.84]KAF1841393.1 hypothetical protein K460DRAFT_318276 [Cucurbitaria berberidis CBS 394.84]
MMNRSEILHANPIGRGLDGFRDAHALNPLDDDNWGGDDEALKNTLVELVLALQSLAASRSLPSKRGNKDLRSDLLSLSSALYSDNADTVRAKPLLDAVLSKQPDEVIWDAVYDAVTESTPPPRPLSSFQQTPWLRNTGSFANSTEHRKYIDSVLKEELGQLYVGVPGFSEAFFGGVPDLKPVSQAVFKQCKGVASLYQEGSGWQGWPEDAKERDVLGWFAPLIGQLVDLAAQNEQNEHTSRPRRRPLAQPHKPIQGSIADRKMDVGFVDDPHADVDARYRWPQILIPGELKSNPLDDKASKAWLDLGRYAREVFAAQPSRRFVLGFTLCGSRMRLWEFDRLGGIASESFDINEDGLQFVSAVLGFLWLDEEQLGYDPTIITEGDKQYTDIERNGCTERLIITGVMKRTRCIAGRATTCWIAHREGDESEAPLVIKDSWQYPERDEEGELLREATEKGVANVARYYYHGTVHVGGQEDDIRENVRRGLDVSQATNYRSESAMPPPSSNGHRSSRTGRSSTATGRKRSSSCTDAPLPPSKRTCSSSPVKGGKAIANRKRRRVILRDLGEPIYKASSLTKLVAGMEGCIEGYESLQTKAGLLQCDISPNNLMINEDGGNPSWHAFLIDLDLAIKEQREKSSGARGKTGTRAFMAVGVLHDDEPHSFMHDLESFFWVLFWICIHYSGSQGRVVPQFDRWNYADTEELAKLKLGTVSDKDIFRKTTQEHFTKYYQPLIPCIDRLRRRVFPGGGRWRDPNPELYTEMKNILRAAHDELKELELSSNAT